MNVVPFKRAPHADRSPVSIWMVTAGGFGAQELLFAVRSEEEAVALVAAGHGDDYQEVRLLAPGAAPVQVRAWSGYIAYRTGEPTVHEELVYAWNAPGPCDDGSLPGGDGQGVYGTNETAVRAAIEAWAHVWDYPPTASSDTQAPATSSTCSAPAARGRRAWRARSGPLPPEGPGPAGSLRPTGDRRARPPCGLQPAAAGHGGRRAQGRPRPAGSTAVGLARGHTARRRPATVGGIVALDRHELARQAATSRSVHRTTSLAVPASRVCRATPSCSTTACHLRAARAGLVTARTRPVALGQIHAGLVVDLPMAESVPATGRTRYQGVYQVVRGVLGDSDRWATAPLRLPNCRPWPAPYPATARSAPGRGKGGTLAVRHVALGCIPGIAGRNSKGGSWV